MDLYVVVFSAAVAAGLILFLPIKGARKYVYHPPGLRFHEADSVLSRRLLEPATSDYDAYYGSHPEMKETDDRSRNAPGLLSGESRYYDRGTYSAAEANFTLLRQLNTFTNGLSVPSSVPWDSPEKSPETPAKTGTPDREARSGIRVNKEKVTGFISTWLLNSGAHRVGFTPLRDYHFYSHKGRGSRSGEPIRRIHENAVVVTVEMDHRMMASAPGGTSVMESSEQYLRSGMLALKTAAFIRELGYDATAHIDGNYEVICPLVAVDAGLGTIGRMGLLMTPRLGPRVRISVVTTNLPLQYTVSRPDRTVLHFCDRCNKCVRACPVSAIPEGAREQVDHSLRWKIDSEKCYHFWTLAGTDCGRCMTVCPYSHSDRMFHRFIRWGIKNNLVFRHLAIKLDDIIYGRKPCVLPLPGWTGLLDNKP